MLASKVNRYTAAKIAYAMNTWAGENKYQEVVTAEEILKMDPIRTHERKGYLIYAYQYGDVTLLAWVRDGNDVTVKHVSW